MRRTSHRIMRPVPAKETDAEEHNFPSWLRKVSKPEPEPEPTVVETIAEAPVKVASAVAGATKSGAKMTVDAAAAAAMAPVKGAGKLAEAVGLKKIPLCDDCGEKRNVCVCDTDEETGGNKAEEKSESATLNWNQFRAMHRGSSNAVVSQLWKDYKRERYDPYADKSLPPPLPEKKIRVA